MPRIGPYEILEELGRGGMGVVYRAFDPGIQRLVAVKVIRLDEATAPDQQAFLRERLLREARSAGALSHPGIVTIHFVGEESGFTYIAMEHVAGVSLDKVLASGAPLGTQRLLEMLEVIAAALDYAHAKGVLHRDVKPGNILLGEHGEVKICDFGIAKTLGGGTSTKTGFRMGSPVYMSPEQVKGEELDGRTDQYSLAAMAYQALTGSPPFQSDRIESLLYKLVMEPPVAADVRNPALSADAAAVLAKGLAKEPGQRYGSCSEFVRMLSAAMAARSEMVGASAQRAGVPPAPEPEPREVEGRCRRCGAVLPVGHSLCGFCASFAGTWQGYSAADVARQQGVAEALRRADELRDQKEYGASLAALEEIGEAPEATELRARVLVEQAEEARQRQVSQFEAALKQANEELAAGNLTQAERLLETLARDKPAGFALTSRLVELRNRIAAVRKNQKVAEASRAALALVESQRFEEACQVLDEALQHYPGEPKLIETLKRVQTGQEEWVRSEAIRQAVEQARAQQDRKDLDGALATVRTAMRTSGPNAELAKLDDELSRAIEERRRRKLEQERAERLSRSIAQVENALTVADLPAARAALSEARGQFGGDPALVAVGKRVEAAIRQAQEEEARQHEEERRQKEQAERERQQAEGAARSHWEATRIVTPDAVSEPPAVPGQAPTATPEPSLIRIPKRSIPREAIISAATVAVLAILFFALRPKAVMNRAEPQAKPPAPVVLAPPKAQAQGGEERETVRGKESNRTTTPSVVTPLRAVNPPTKGNNAHPTNKEVSRKPGSSETAAPVAPPPSIQQFEISPASIDRGQGATLQWNATGADSIQIVPDIGSVGTSGSRQVSPVDSVTYTLIAKGPGGEARRTTSIEVTAPVPAPTINSFDAEPRSIHSRGESSTLRWSVSKAATVSIDQGIGQVAQNGSRMVFPAETTTYTLVAIGPGGEDRRRITVEVIR